MSSVADKLKPSEAAVVAGVRRRDIDRAIDEHILPSALIGREEGRLLSREACAYIAFYFASADRLTADERLRTISTLCDRHAAHPDIRPANLLDRDWTMHHEFLSINVRGFAEKVIERLARLEAARARVTTSNGVLGGTPVFRGTRIPVHDVAALVASGIAQEELLEDYPALDAESLELAVLYAEANPLRGRPRPLLAGLPKGTKLKSERRVARKPRG